jgi:radical SAM protein with 4Fe4S-binding SPASM domain
MLKKGVCIIMTDRCNANCKICGLGCSPEKNNVIDEALMLKIISQAKEQGGIEDIGFSGGEPFLYYDLLKKGLLYAKKSGFRTSVATNGFWGKWPDTLLNERLRALPIDQMTISTDYYHQQYIPEENLKRAIEVTKAIQISVEIAIGETESGTSSGDFFGELGSYKYMMPFYIYPFMRVGRACELPEDEFYCDVDSRNVRCNPMGLIGVRYDGEVFPCCEQMVFETGLSMGNIHNRTLTEILSDPHNSELFSFLETKEGLNSAVKIAEKELGFKRQSMCSGGCEICHALFKNQETVDRLRQYIAEEYWKLPVS